MPVLRDASRPGVRGGHAVWNFLLLSLGFALFLAAAMAGIVWLGTGRASSASAVDTPIRGVVELSRLDRIEVGPGGDCLWERQLRLANNGIDERTEFAVRFPGEAFLPFEAYDSSGWTYRTSARAESDGLRLAITLSPPLKPLEERRLILRARVRGLVRLDAPGSDRATLRLPMWGLARASGPNSLIVRLPPGASAHPVPESLPWQTVVAQGDTDTLVWRRLEQREPDDHVELVLSASAFQGRLPARMPWDAGRARTATALSLTLILGALAMLWRGPVRWHEAMLALVMGVQLVLFLQPMLLEDNLSYLAYARSAWLDADLDLANDFKLYNSYLIFSPDPLEPPGPTGAAVMLAPFFLLGGLFRTALQWTGWMHPANGFSWPYLAAMALGGYFYAFLAVVLSYRIARDLVAPRPAAAAALAMAQGTNLFLVTYFWTACTHAPSVFLVTLFLRLWVAGRGQRSMGGWVVLGLLGGMATQTRYQNGLFLALPLLDFLGAPAIGPGDQAPGKWRRLLGRLTAYGAAAALGASTQVILWWMLQGAPVVDNYGVSAGRFGHTLERLPKLLLGKNALFDSSGIWVSMPVLAVSWLTLAWCWRRSAWPVRLMGLVLAGQLAVVSSYDTYWGRLIYGSAYLVNCTAISTVGLAMFLAGARRRGTGKGLLALALAAACLWQMRLTMRQLAFEQVTWAGNYSLTGMLEQLWLLPPAIEQANYRVLSGNFGHLLREFLTPGGETVPSLALLGVAALAMALGCLRWGRAASPAEPRAFRGVAIVLALYCLAASAVAWRISRVGRALAWEHDSQRAPGVIGISRVVDSCNGPQTLPLKQPGPYRWVYLVTHLAGGESTPQGQEVARMTVKSAAGRHWSFPLRAGIETVSGDALRPGAAVAHAVPWGRIVHQWRTRDASSVPYWGLGCVADVDLGASHKLESVTVEPVHGAPTLLVSDLVAIGERTTASTPATASATGSRGAEPGELELTAPATPPSAPSAP